MREGGSARTAILQAVALGSALVATAAIASPAVRETLFVGSSEGLVALDPVTLEARGEIPIAKASAVAAELGVVWSLDGSTLRAHTFDGSLLAEAALPLEESPPPR